MKTVLITGGCGFIGSNFIKLFLKSHPDWQVINLDKLSYSGNLDNTRDFQKDPRYEFVRGDICDTATVGDAMRKADAVIHFAAETHVDRSIECAAEFLKTNVMGTQIMMDAAMKRGVARHIHISTDEVYGSLKEGSAKEDSPLKPNSPYAASKAAADLLVRAYRKTYQFPAIIVRSTNNFGPFQFPEKVIPLFITNLFEGKKVPLYGAGENRRDWIFVEDNCRAIENIFDKGEDGKTYNVGAGHEISNLELTGLILKLTGLGEDRIQSVEDRPGHDFRYSINPSQLRGLGFELKWSLEEGLQRTIEWYRENADWWKPLKKDKYTVK